MKQGTRKEYLDGTRRHGCCRFPFEKFLKSRLGQPWSKVHSELSKEFDRRTYAGYSFWRSVEWTLVTHCWIGAKTGTVYDNSPHWHRGVGYGTRVCGYYVHPFTGILSYQEPKKREKEPKKPLNRIVIDDRRAIEKLDGIWYLTGYKKEELGAYWRYYNPELKDYVVTTKRQLNSKELKLNKLTNDSAEQILDAKEKALRDKELMKKIANEEKQNELSNA